MGRWATEERDLRLGSDGVDGLGVLAELGKGFMQLDEDLRHNECNHRHKYE